MSVIHKEFLLYVDIQKIEHVCPAKTGPLQTDKEGFQFIPIPAIEPAPKTKVKTLLCILLIILLTLMCVGLIGVVWFGPRWPTYEISYTIQRYSLKIGGLSGVCVEHTDESFKKKLILNTHYRLSYDHLGIIL